MSAALFLALWSAPCCGPRGAAIGPITLMKASSGSTPGDVDEAPRGGRHHVPDRSPLAFLPVVGPPARAAAAHAGGDADAENRETRATAELARHPARAPSRDDAALGLPHHALHRCERLRRGAAGDSNDQRRCSR